MLYNLDNTVNCFYINLDDNHERRNHIENNLYNYGFTNVSRIPAVDTRTIENLNRYRSMIDPTAYDQLLVNIQTGKRNSHRELTKGAVGCYLSHLNIYRHIVESQIPYALIFEDDCKFVDDPSNFWKKINGIKIPDDTDMFLFDSSIHELNRSKCPTNSPTNNVCQVYFFFGTYFYFITLEGARKALNHLLPIEYQIDSKLAMMSYANRIKLYGYVGTKFAKQDNKFGTTIQFLKCPKCNIAREIVDMKSMVDWNHMIIGVSVCALLAIVIIILILFTLYC